MNKKLQSITRSVYFTVPKTCISKHRPTKMKRKDKKWPWRGVENLLVGKEQKMSICRKREELMQWLTLLLKNTTLIWVLILQCYVSDGQAGASPLKMCLDGGVPNDLSGILLFAFETYIHIKQITRESENNTGNLLSACVNKTMSNVSNTCRLFDWLLHEITMTCDFMATLKNEGGDGWTTFNSILMRFNELDFTNKIIGENGVAMLNVCNELKTWF